MHSLLTRITILTIAAVLISIAFLGLVSVLSMRADGEANAQKLMDVLCEEKCLQINHYLESREDIDATESGDSDYDTLQQAVSKMKVLDGGYVFLTDADGRIVYHPLLAAGTPVSRMSDSLDAVSASASSDKMVAYRFYNERMRAVWDTLDNGQKLIIAVPEDEVNAGWRGLAALILIIGSMLLGVFALVTVGIIAQVTQPLQRLVRASKQVAEGNYDVDLKYDEDDEVGAVSKAFNQMAQQLKAFVGDLNSRAYKDSLTRVSNKGAFEIAAKDLDERILAGGADNAPEFAIAVFDCNDLKSINDNYGHDKGDIYLKTACMTICNVFAHSPVFWIGSLPSENRLRFWKKSHHIRRLTFTRQIRVSVFLFRHGISISRS